MPRQPRHFEPRSLLEITSRTIHGRLLMRPSPTFNDIFVGALGYAQTEFGLDLHVYAALSNHYHFLCSPEHPEQLSGFMRLFNSKLAREIGRLHDWREKVWGRRFSQILVSNEPAAQIARLKYILAHGAKEGLVASPRDWPGPHAVHALLTGEAPQGLWFNRTLEYQANRKGVEFGVTDFATVQTVQLTPLPCWGHLDARTYRERVGEIVDVIEEEARQRQRETGREPRGTAFVMRQRPHERPMRSKRAPAPYVHAASKAVRKMLIEAQRAFVAAYRRASQRLKAGDLTVTFPPLCFPPRLPFVGWTPAFATPPT